MFEDYTYSALLSEMLSEVTTAVDKREGSIIFDTLSPAAIEIANSYINMESILSNAFADTADREHLILIAKERGLTPEDATYAVLKAVFNFNSYNGEYIGEIVSAGDRFSLDKINYTLIEQMTADEDTSVTDDDGNDIAIAEGELLPGVWQIQCETAGTEGNTHFGTLTPITSISGLTKAVITELLIPGENEEDTETFRQRYFDSISSDAFGGNRADYVAWVSAIDGVGQVKAKRTPNGGGTVGIIITDSDGNAASSTLIESVKEALDPEEYTGQGEGTAPIGHSVTVSTVSTYSITVTLGGITYTDDVTEDGTADVQSAMQAVLEAYADEINAGWEDRTTTKVYAAQCLARCLDVTGIENIESAYVDGASYVTVDDSYIIEFAMAIE